MPLVLKGSTCDDEEYREPFACCRWVCKLEQPLWKVVWMFLKKLNIKLSCDQAILPLGIYLNEVKSLS